MAKEPTEPTEDEPPKNQPSNERFTDDIAFEVVPPKEPGEQSTKELELKLDPDYDSGMIAAAQGRARTPSKSAAWLAGYDKMFNNLRTGNAKGGAQNRQAR